MKGPGPCVFCGMPTPRGVPVSREMTGWAQDRAKGEHGLRLRRVTGRVAHPLCVDRAVRNEQAEVLPGLT